MSGHAAERVTADLAARLGRQVAKHPPRPGQSCVTLGEQCSPLLGRARLVRTVGVGGHVLMLRRRCAAAHGAIALSFRRVRRRQIIAARPGGRRLRGVAGMPDGKTVRLAEVVAALSLGTDLGMGLPMEHVLRQWLISMRLADRAGLDPADHGVVYYTALLAWGGCHVDAYEQAKWFGDDLALKADCRTVDFAGPAATARFMLEHFGAGLPMVERAKLGVEMMRSGRPRPRAAWERHCYAADALAGRLALGQRVRRSILQTFERWDGKGVPDGAKGDDILPTARIVNLADVVEVYQRIGGTSSAIAVARERSGTQFDPALVEVFCSAASDIFTELAAVTTWDAVIAGEP